LLSLWKRRTEVDRLSWESQNLIAEQRSLEAKLQTVYQAIQNAGTLAPQQQAGHLANLHQLRERIERRIDEIGSRQAELEEERRRQYAALVEESTGSVMRLGATGDELALAVREELGIDTDASALRKTIRDAQRQANEILEPVFVELRTGSVSAEERRCGPLTQPLQRTPPVASRRASPLSAKAVLERSRGPVTAPADSTACAAW
jgi:hypothetical protein